MKVIGITGKAGAGKNVLADHLMDILRKDNKVVDESAFGNGVKECCSMIFQEPLIKFFTSKSEVSDQWGITYRRMMQIVGTDFGRNMIDESIWIKRVNKAVRESEKQGVDFFIITDVRKNNEAEYILSEDGTIIDVIRPRKDTELTPEEQQHASEDGIDSAHVHFTVNNDGTFRDLYLNAEYVLKNI